MREIEFRAWHRKYKYISRVADISFNRGVVNLNSADISKIEDIELMQYTGLKDKNGVKIFEGDIVKTYSDYVYVVYFDERSGAFGLITGSPYEDRKWFDDISNMVVINNLEVYKNLEVIGNIYENPELLGDNND